jgi:murein L,D-transpeptidase YafK
MTDYGIEEIYGLVYEAFQGGQAKIQLQYRLLLLSLKSFLSRRTG